MGGVRERLPRRPARRAGPGAGGERVVPSECAAPYEISVVRDGDLAGCHTGIDGRTTAVLGRLAVGRAARGTGLGALLVRAVEAEARRLGLAEVYLESQTHALGFYEKLGYRAYGPEFDEGSGIPHRAMRRTL
ncbi:GNAT family N-acetyltransferase [Streptomyces sp. P1-3]|uniref:GNAT family N-acetyltransferase n=1 Tax=Streptomyces sp. P1-3 TaxID=3421658 RepID=UPI003D365E75